MAAGPRKLAQAVGVILILLMSWGMAYSDLAARIGEPSTLSQAVVSLGAWGYLAYIAAYALLQPFGLPGTLFIVAAPLIWPWPTAFVLSMTGTMAASVVGFGFARFVAKDWVSRRIPASLRQYDAALASNGFMTVLILRLVLWMPQPLHAFFGISSVRFWTHFWGSLIGYVPPLLMVSYLAAEMFDANGRMLPAALPIMGTFLALSLVTAFLARYWERHCVSSGSLSPRTEGSQ